MSRVTTLGFAFLFAFCAYAIQAVQLPGRVLACSCAPPLSFAELANEPRVAVFTGTVGRQLVDRYPIQVDTWFHGAGSADIVWIESGEIPDGQGGVTVNTCGPILSAGDTRLFVAHGVPPAMLSTNSCLPGTSLDAPEGQELMAQARAVFGSGISPPSPPPEPAAPVDLMSWFAGWGWIAALGLVALALFGAVVLLARREPPG